jgi:hypothetical protein
MVISQAISAVKYLPTFSTSPVPFPIYIKFVQEKITIKITMFDT